MNRPPSVGDPKAEQAVFDARERKAFRERAKQEGYKYAVIPGTWAGEHLDRIGTKKELDHVKAWADEYVTKKHADWVEVRDAQSWMLVYLVTNE